MSRTKTDGLTPRQAQVLTLMGKGLSNSEIGAVLWVSERTVQSHITEILHKLSARNRTHAVALTARGLLPDSYPDPDSYLVHRKDSMSMIKVGDYVIVRTEMAGVFAGALESCIGTEVALTGARRIWHWKGAASLSQLAAKGTSNPGGCKFPMEVPAVLLRGVIEVLAVTESARKSIAEVPIWQE